MADGTDIPTRHLDGLAWTSSGRGLVQGEIRGLLSSALSQHVSNNESVAHVTGADIHRA